MSISLKILNAVLIVAILSFVVAPIYQPHAKAEAITVTVVTGWVIKTAFAWAATKVLDWAWSTFGPRIKSGVSFTASMTTNCLQDASRCNLGATLTPIASLSSTQCKRYNSNWLDVRVAKIWTLFTKSRNYQLYSQTVYGCVSRSNQGRVVYTF